MANELYLLYILLIVLGLAASVRPGSETQHGSGITRPGGDDAGK